MIKLSQKSSFSSALKPTWGVHSEGILINDVGLRREITMFSLFATTRSVCKSVKVSVVEIAKRTN